MNQVCINENCKLDKQEEVCNKWLCYRENLHQVTTSSIKMFANGLY